jgi:PAS domain S-box-containing protein
MGSIPEKLNRYLFGVLAVLALVILSYISSENFLLFHSLTEGFSICIAFCIFVVAWNSRQFSENDYLLFLGCAYLFIAFLDLIHTFAYKGMNIFTDLGPNPATQLWIAARYMESVALLVAPFWLTRRLRLGMTSFCFAILTTLVLSAVFYWHVFPDCFVVGYGLTPFKKFSEYIICLFLMGALASLWLNRGLMDEKVNHLVLASIVVTMASELCFTFYVSVYGFSNIFGHVLKIISFYLIYKAIIENGLRRPYHTMFSNLKESEARYQQVFDTNQAVKLLIDPGDGAIIEANQAACDFYGYSKEEILTRKITHINMLPPNQVHEEMARAKSENRLFFNFPHRLASGEIRDVEVYSGPVKTGERTLLFSIVHDVTDRNKAEKN